ncbi:MAG TPA: hypothetical protein VFF04_05455 [Candidatus Babeliales bacterium]|nr:hypothetical protein [Candidatus Babeliales bacterium]
MNKYLFLGAILLMNIPLFSSDQKKKGKGERPRIQSFSQVRKSREANYNLDSMIKDPYTGEPLSPGSPISPTSPSYDSVQESLLAQTKTKPRNCIKKVGIGCGTLSFIGLVVVATLAITGQLSSNSCPLNNCMKPDESLTETCFGIKSCDRPKQTLCSFSGTVQEFLESDQGRFFSSEPNSQLCLQRVSCRGLGCTMPKKE